MVETIVGIIVVFTVLTFVLIAFQRSLDKPGGRTSAGGFADALGGFIDVFDPAQKRATDNLNHEKRRGPVTPTPDDDLERPVVIETFPDGTPRRVRIRRPNTP
ncbi:MAG: hypothetical protein WAW88_13060 [Nocardioides sp.]